MNYKTSTNYERLRELLDNRENVIVIAGCCVYFASYDNYKGYYIGDSWFEHDIEFSEFANKDTEALREFCEQYKLEFIDPADYPVCVPKNAENWTQNSLCRTDETQRRSVWHSPDEVPQIPAGKTRVRIVFISDDKGFRAIHSDSFHTLTWWHIETIETHMVKWMYFDDLEAL